MYCLGAVLVHCLKSDQITIWGKRLQANSEGKKKNEGEKEWEFWVSVCLLTYSLLSQQDGSAGKERHLLNLVPGAHMVEGKSPLVELVLRSPLNKHTNKQ